MGCPISGTIQLHPFSQQSLLLRVPQPWVDCQIFIHAKFFHLRSVPVTPAHIRALEPFVMDGDPGIRSLRLPRLSRHLTPQRINRIRDSCTSTSRRKSTHAHTSSRP